MPPKKNSTEKQEDTKDSTEVNDGATEILKTINSLIANDKNKEELSKEHKFWDTQPVIHTLGNESNYFFLCSEFQFSHFTEVKETDMGPIDKPKTVADIQKEPYKLPDGFDWVETDVDKEETVKLEK